MRRSHPNAVRPPATTLIAALTALLFVVLAHAPTPAAADTPDTPDTPGTPAADATIDFARDVRPILQRRCVSCHGPMKQKGGLRLDERQYAVAGTDSGSVIVGGDVGTNEIYRRVTADAPKERMPQKADPLPDDERETLRRWVEQGSPWPDATSNAELAERAGWWDHTTQTLRHWYHTAVGYIRPYLFVIVAGLGVVVLVERGRKLKQADHRWTRGRGGWLFRMCAARRPSHYAVGLLLLTCAILVDYARDKTIEADRLALERDGLTGKQTVWNVFGDPPIPFRPLQPAALERVYYRGNDERDPELFNGGYYRTATFHVDVCDAQMNTLHYGDVPAPGELYIRLNIERAPLTTPHLFTDMTISRVWLSDGLMTSDRRTPSHAIVDLQTIEPLQRWSAHFPIGPAPGKATAMQGVVYLYVGRRDNDPPTGVLRHGIRYDLAFDDTGRVLPKSDLWMGSLLVWQKLVVVPPGKLPMTEWFSDKPIPEIVGHNTDDPVLLGLPEHLGKNVPARNGPADHTPNSAEPQGPPQSDK